MLGILIRILLTHGVRRINRNFLQTGDNATAAQANKMSRLRRIDCECFRFFIKKIDYEKAFLRKLDGEQPDDKSCNKPNLNYKKIQSKHSVKF